MVVLLDTSAIYAAADRDDINHAGAVRLFEGVVQAGHDLLVHNYVIVEAAALLLRRRGWEATTRLLGHLSPFRIHWVDEALHRRAVDRFVQRRGRFSLVDEVSFLVMREGRISVALTFDQDFTREGFSLFPGS